jgi:hypothetical protein
MLTYGLVYLHDIALPRPHTAARTRVLLEHFNWELFDHTPYSPDLGPSDNQRVLSCPPEERVEIAEIKK